MSKRKLGLLNGWIYYPGLIELNLYLVKNVQMRGFVGILDILGPLLAHSVLTDLCPPKLVPTKIHNNNNKQLL